MLQIGHSSSLKPLFQSESKCSLLWMSVFIHIEIELIRVTKNLHLDTLGQRDWGELRNEQFGLLKYSTVLKKVLHAVSALVLALVKTLWSASNLPAIFSTNQVPTRGVLSRLPLWLTPLIVRLCLLAQQKATAVFHFRKITILCSMSNNLRIITEGNWNVTRINKCFR